MRVVQGSFPPSPACSTLACRTGLPFMVLSINLLHVSKGVCSLDDLSAIEIAPFLSASTWAQFIAPLQMGSESFSAILLVPAVWEGYGSGGPPLPVRPHAAPHLR